MPLSRRCWVFDLDGTLTLAQHDFDALKRDLGLPPELAVLEGLETVQEPRRSFLVDAIHRWEIELAEAARPAPGARELLEALADRGAAIGLLTRNTRDAALLTLEHTGLLGWFRPDRVLGRHEARPKPSPDGVLQLLARADATPADGVMVGDFAFDLQAGRAAGTMTVWVDAEGTDRFRDLADVVIRRLDDLLR